MTLSMEETIDYSKYSEHDQGYIRGLRAGEKRDLQRVKEEGEVLSILTATPEWEMYGRKLGIEINRATAIKERIEKLFLDPQKVLSPADYMEAKVRQGQAAAYLDALNFALNVAKTLIEKGEVAVAELNLIDASRTD